MSDYYLGTMCGTSLDAFDVSVLKTSKANFKVIGFKSYKIDDDLRKKLGIKEMVQALCHEMVHVKQYARNEMNDGIVKGRARWKTKTIPENTNYWDLPWEKEAYRMEKKLANSVWENGVI